MKKLWLGVLAVLVMLTLAACGKSYASLGVKDKYTDNLTSLTGAESDFINDYGAGSSQLGTDTHAKTVDFYYKKLTGISMGANNQFDTMETQLATKNADKAQAKALVHETNVGVADMIGVPEKNQSEVVKMMDAAAYK